MSTALAGVPAAVEVYGNPVVPAVGSYVIPDGRSVGESLMPGDPAVDSGYVGCQFRLPAHSAVIRSVACNVEVVGRVPQRKCGRNYIRVRITWVGDCEPDTHSGGWMLLDW